MTIAVRAEGLTKSFGDVHALRGIDLEVPTGTVLGLLGPNGAGKTTAVRILTTLLLPDAGRGTVAGLDVVDDATALRSRIGLTGQYAAVDGQLTGRENLVLVGRLHRMEKREARQRADALLEQFELTDAATRPAKTYSGGMRRRLDLAASLINDPEVLFLDEPTTGLDPRSRLALWGVIEELVAGGTTLLLTTQYLDEADRLADRIAVIDHGSVIAEGTADELKTRVGGEVLVVRAAELANTEDVCRAVAEAAGAHPDADEVTGEVTATVAAGADALVAVVRRLSDEGVELADVGLRRPSLDDVFLALTGHPAEPEVDENEDPSAGPATTPPTTPPTPPIAEEVRR